MRITPSKKTKAEIRDHKTQSAEDLWKRYFALPPGPEAIALLAQIRGCKSMVSDDSNEDED